jgi:hypothetical protein
MLPKATVEYVAGPACGRTRTVPVGPSGQPPPQLSVTVPAVWASALDDRPIAPETVHLYERSPNPTGTRWHYRHLGPAR